MRAREEELKQARLVDRRAYDGVQVDAKLADAPRLRVDHQVRSREGPVGRVEGRELVRSHRAERQRRRDRVLLVDPQVEDEAHLRQA